MKPHSIDFRHILEAAIKFNFILLIASLIAIYVRIIEIPFYFSLIEYQALTLTLAIIFGKIYERMRFKIGSNNLAIYQSSLFIGIIIFYALSLLFEFFILAQDQITVLLINFFKKSIVALLYLSCTLLLSKYLSFRLLIKILDTTLSYKNFMHLFILINTSLVVILIAVALFNTQQYSTEITSKRILINLFIILYFEISFLIFHIVIAKAIDFFWHNNRLISSHVSLFGMIIGSITYVAKLNIIDEQLFEILDTSSLDSKTSLIAIIVLSLFWCFIALLFNLKTKYPRTRQI